MFASHQRQFASRTAAIASREAQAAKAGNTRVATHLAQVVTRRNGYLARHQAKLAGRTARAVQVHGLVDGACS